MKVNQQDWIGKWAVYQPEKVAVRELDTGRELSYRALNRLGNRMAHRLTAHHGLQKGDRIALLADNCLEFLVFFVAAQKTGCVLVPINYRLAPAEIDYLLENAAPKLVVGAQKYKTKLEVGTAYRQIARQWSMEAVAEFCDPKAVSAEEEHFPIQPVDENDPIFILYTSGTTGFPKGALYTHKMLFWNSINTAMTLLVNTESRTINVMPFFHTGGWNVLTTPFLHHGGFVGLMKKFDADRVLQGLQTEKATLFMGVPTMLNLMAQTVGFQEADLSSLHYLIVGGEPMPVPLIETWGAKKVAVRQGYGMTEVGPNLTSLHQDDAIRKKGSIGRPNFYVEIKIVDRAGAPVSSGQAGELLLRGPMLTPGYWQNEQATQAAIQDGWFYSGDLLVQDDEGYLFVVDRLKNMYISGGENVYPAEVERVLLEHSAVSEAAVVSIPDEQWGEVGRAFVVRKQAVEAPEIIWFCRDRLAKFKIPKSIVFVDQLPKNDTGKIDRKQLLKKNNPLKRE